MVRYSLDRRYFVCQFICLSQVYNVFLLSSVRLKSIFVTSSLALLTRNKNLDIDIRQREKGPLNVVEYIFLEKEDEIIHS